MVLAILRTIGVVKLIEEDTVGEISGSTTENR
jgi:hypothetical protein